MKKITDDKLERIIQIIIENVNPDKIILFGSRAKGNVKGFHDYDICVLKKDIVNNRKLAMDIYGMLYGTGAAVDLIVENPEHFDPRQYLGPARQELIEMIKRKNREVLGSAEQAKYII